MEIIEKTSIKWSVEEIEFLKKNYETMPKENILKTLHNRSWGAIQRIASSNKLKRDCPNSFSSSEIKFIQENYRTMSDEEIGLKLNRSKSSIKAKRCKLGLLNQNSFNWTDGSLLFLRENYQTMTDLEIAQIIGCSKKEVLNKRNLLNFKKTEKPKKWTDEQLLLLKEIYPFASKAHILSRFNRTWSGIKSKAIEMKIKRNEYESSWRNGDDDKVKSLYLTMTDEEIAKILNRQKNEVQNRREKLGLFKANNKIWSTEEIEYIKKCCNKFESTDQFLKSYMNHFGKISKEALMCKAYNLGFKLKDMNWSESEHKILKENWFYKTPEEIADIINEELGINRTPKSIISQASKMEVSSRDNYLKFKKNEIKKECNIKGWKIIDLSNYENSRSLLPFKCKCGNIFHTSFENYKNKNKRTCDNCTEKRMIALYSFSFEEAINKVSERHCNNIIVLSKEYLNSSQYGKFKCKIDNHEWGARWGHILHGHGCPKCSNMQTSIRQSLTINYILEKLPRINNEIKLLSNTVKNSKEKLWWLCLECNKKYKMIWNNVQSGQQCPYCTKSKGEQGIRKFLDSNDIYYIPQKKFYNLLGVGGGNLSYDFYLSDYKLLIEYQGEHHENPVDFNGEGLKKAKEKFKIQKKHDERKREYAENNNIKLLEIWYWDFDNIEEILENELKYIDNKCAS